MDITENDLKPSQGNYFDDLSGAQSLTDRKRLYLANKYESQVVDPMRRQLKDSITGEQLYGQQLNNSLRGIRLEEAELDYGDRTGFDNGGFTDDINSVIDSPDLTNEEKQKELYKISMRYPSLGKNPSALRVMKGALGVVGVDNKTGSKGDAILNSAANTLLPEDYSKVQDLVSQGDITGARGLINKGLSTRRLTEQEHKLNIARLQKSIDRRTKDFDYQRRRVDSLWDDYTKISMGIETDTDKISKSKKIPVVEASKRAVKNARAGLNATAARIFKDVDYSTIRKWSDDEVKQKIEEALQKMRSGSGGMQQPLSPSAKSAKGVWGSPTTPAE